MNPNPNGNDEFQWIRDRRPQQGRLVAVAPETGLNLNNKPKNCCFLPNDTRTYGLNILLCLLCMEAFLKPLDEKWETIWDTFPSLNHLKPYVKMVLTSGGKLKSYPMTDLVLPQDGKKGSLKISPAFTFDVEPFSEGIFKIVSESNGVKTEIPFTFFVNQYDQSKIHLVRLAK